MLLKFELNNETLLHLRLKIFINKIETNLKIIVKFIFSKI